MIILSLYYQLFAISTYYGQHFNILCFSNGVRKNAMISHFIVTKTLAIKCRIYIKSRQRLLQHNLYLVNITITSRTINLTVWIFLLNWLFRSFSYFKEKGAMHLIMFCLYTELKRSIMQNCTITDAFIWTSLFDLFIWFLLFYLWRPIR